MILSLLRRSDALRGLPVIGGTLLLAASLSMGVLVTHALKEKAPISATPFVLVGWATVALFLLLSSLCRRASALHLALPIPGRHLWLAQAIANVLAAAVLAGAYAGAAAVHLRLLRSRIAVDTDSGPLGALIVAAAILAAVLLQAWRPSLARVPFTAGYAAWAGLFLLAFFPLLLLLAPSGWFGPPLLLAAAVGVTAWAYGRVPAALQLVPREPRSGRLAAPLLGERDASRADVALPSRSAWIPYFAPMRCLTLAWKEIPILATVAAAGLFAGGCLEILRTDVALRNMRFSYIPLLTYVLFTLVPPRLASIYHVDALPLSRRRIFAILTLPTATLFTGAVALGDLAGKYLAPPTEYVTFEREGENGHFVVNVPLRVYDLVWDDSPRVITSPWGESHAVEPIPLIRGTRAVAWNPFSAPPGSSSRLVALQISRAAEAVYGATLSPEEIESRWLATLADGTVVNRTPSLPLRAENPGYAPRTGPMLPVMVALVLAPWLLLVAALFRAYRAGIPEWAGHAAFWSVVVLFVLTMIGQAVLLVRGITPIWIYRALVEIPVWELGRSAIGTAVAWFASALLVLGAYLVAERQFARMEIPPKPLRFSLLGSALLERTPQE